MVAATWWVLAGILAAVLAGLGDIPAKHAAQTGLGKLTGRHTLPGGRSYYLSAGSGWVGLPRPLVIALHGAYQNPRTMQRLTGLTQYAESHGFSLVYGVGIGGRWNAGPQCCAVSDARNDVAYVRAVIADAERRTPVDRSRVYVVGFSNGGMLAVRAACELPEVTAAATVSGPLLVPCKRPIRLWHLHGTADLTVPVGGGVGFEGRKFPSSWTEGSRLPAHSVWVAQWWSGDHAWPSWATNDMWTALSKWSSRAAWQSPTATPSSTQQHPATSGRPVVGAQFFGRPGLQAR